MPLTYIYMTPNFPGMERALQEEFVWLSIYTLKHLDAFELTTIIYNFLISIFFSD